MMYNEMQTNEIIGGVKKCDSRKQADENTDEVPK